MKRTRFTTITPIPSSVKRENVVEILHQHIQMIDLNPFVVERNSITPPDAAKSDELLWQWYRIEQGFQSGFVKYDLGFHDLEDGLETQAYVPLGVESKSKWTIGIETLPREFEEAEGAPVKKGLCVKEEVDMRSFILMTWFVKRTMKKAHAEMGRRLQAKLERLSETQQDQSNEKVSEENHDLTNQKFLEDKQDPHSDYLSKADHDRNGSGPLSLAVRPVEGNQYALEGEHGYPQYAIESGHSYPYLEYSIEDSSRSVYS